MITKIVIAADRGKFKVRLEVETIDSDCPAIEFLAETLDEALHLIERHWTQELKFDNETRDMWFAPWLM